jgi:hydrogenase maturation protease
MKMTSSRCLILACGNTLRGDDGVGPWLAEWAKKRFITEAGLRVVARQQWTPELAEEIAGAESVLFIDSSVDCPAGAVRLFPVEAAAGERGLERGLATHHLGVAELLALGRDLYASTPRSALLLTVGADSTELGEEFSARVKAALPEACRLLEETILRVMGGIKGDHWGGAKGNR